MINAFPIAGVSAAFSDSGFSGKLIVFLLFIGSIYAWSIMVVKLKQLSMAQSNTDRFIAAYRKEDNPVGLFVRRSHFKGSPYYEIYMNACNALGEAFELSGLDDDELLMGDVGSSHKLSKVQIDSINGLSERVMAEQVLVLDIVRAGHEPGTLYSLDEDDLVKNEKQVLSLHDVDLLDSLDMARMRGHRPKLKVVGIEPDKIDWGTEMTPVLVKALPSFMNVARKHIEKLLN